MKMTMLRKREQTKNFIYQPLQQQQQKIITFELRTCVRSTSQNKTRMDEWTESELKQNNNLRIAMIINAPGTPNASE